MTRKRPPTDKDMLDWLQRNNALLDASCFGDKHAWIVVETDNGAAGARTVRKAIAAAMSASRKR